MDNDEVLEIAEFYINTNSTYRKTAKEFKCSRTKVARVINKRLRVIDYDLYKKAQALKNKNKKEATMRGGMSFKRKHADIIDYNMKRTLEVMNKVSKESISLKDALKSVHLGSITYYKYMRNNIKSMYPEIYKEYLEGIRRLKKERSIKNFKLNN